MRTYLECIPCFFKQAIEACNMTGLPEKETKAVLDRIALHIPQLDMATSPPAMALAIHSILKEYTHNTDPYKELKEKSNRLALESYPALKKIVAGTPNRLLKAVEIAIAGNIIDYGAIADLDVEKEIASIIDTEENIIKNEDPRYFAFEPFVAALTESKSLLYLADNAGEIVCDRILIEEIMARFPSLEITVAVRGEPILNDCTLEDAAATGLDRLITVMTNGSQAPGTILETCAPEFMELWEKSDMVISKGQGNFESLSDNAEKIFFLFIAKCPVLTRDIGCKLRDIILYENGS